MSSISSSDRANTTDEIRRIREEYEAKESENAKKKNREIRSNNEKHERHVAEIRGDYERQLDNVRQKHREILDERDRKHTGDVDKIKDLYMESIKKKTLDSDRMAKEQKESFENQIKKERSISAQQKELSERNFRESTRQREIENQQSQQKNSGTLQDALRERSESLADIHKKELKAVEEDRDRRVANMRIKEQDQKSAYEDRIDTDNRNHRLEKARLVNTFETEIRNKDKITSSQLANKDLKLQDAIDDLNLQYSERYKNESAKMANLRKTYAEDLEGRMASQIRRAKSEAAQAKTDRSAEAISEKRLNDIEKRNIRRDYQARELDLVRQKDYAVEKAKDMIEERVTNVVRKNEKMMTEMNRRNRHDENLEKLRTKEAMVQFQSTSEDQLNLANKRADERVKNIMNESNRQQQAQFRNYEDGVNVIKENYSNRLTEQRDAGLENTQSVYNSMQQRLKTIEQAQTKKFDDTVKLYEQKISEMKEDHERELQRMSKLYETKTAQQQKANKTDQEGIKLKYEQKLASMEDTQRKELERSEQRHQEQLQNVVSRMNAAANNRKA